MSARIVSSNQEKNQNQKSNSWLLILVILALVVAAFYFFSRKGQQETIKTVNENVSQKQLTPATSKPTPILTSTPTCRNQMVLGTDIADLNIINNQTIPSPASISGKIKGSFCFEGNCGLNLLDGAGNIIYTGSFMLEGDWMTEELVPFTAEFNFDAIATEVPNGRIVILADNPSGLPENSWCYEIPVKLIH